MAKAIMTHLLCYDDHHSFTDDIRKRFTDPSRYVVDSFVTFQDFIARCVREREKKSCKVAIIGVPDAPEHFELIEKFTGDIRKTDARISLILLGPPDKMEELKKIVKFNIDAYIPKNSNAIVRIHNAVKKLISEHTILVFRRRRNLSLYILVAFMILAGLLFIIARIRLPEYF